MTSTSSAQTPAVGRPRKENPWPSTRVEALRQQLISEQTKSPISIRDLAYLVRAHLPEGAIEYAPALISKELKGEKTPAAGTLGALDRIETLREAGKPLEALPAKRGGGRNPRKIRWPVERINALRMMLSGESADTPMSIKAFRALVIAKIKAAHDNPPITGVHNHLTGANRPTATTEAALDAIDADRQAGVIPARPALTPPTLPPGLSAWPAPKAAWSGSEVFWLRHCLRDKKKDFMLPLEFLARVRSVISDNSNPDEPLPARRDDLRQIEAGEKPVTPTLAVRLNALAGALLNDDSMSNPHAELMPGVVRHALWLAGYPKRLSTEADIPARTLQRVVIGESPLTPDLSDKLIQYIRRATRAD